MEKRQIIDPIIASILFLISITRMHYSLERTVIAQGSLYYVVSSELATTPFVVWLGFFSDVILPFVLLVGMIVLSTLFRVAVFKHQRKRLVKKAKMNHAFNQIQPAGSQPAHSLFQQQGVTMVEVKEAPVSHSVNPIPLTDSQTLHSSQKQALKVAEINGAASANDFYSLLSQQLLLCIARPNQSKTTHQDFAHKEQHKK